MKIIYIDDAAEDLEYVKANFKNAIVTDSIEIASKFILDKEVTHLICDLHLGAYSGFDVIKILKSRRPDIIYYIASGLVGSSSDEHIQKLGLEGFLVKPLSIDLI